MSKKRAYNEGCAVSHALDLVGERWALLVVRELLIGPKRYADLRDALTGASSSILSRRLQDLEEIGVVRKFRAPAPVSATVYELTEWGRALEPVLFALGNWAIRSPFWDRHAPSTIDSLVLALRSQAAFIFPDGAPIPGAYDVWVDDCRNFTLTFGADGLSVSSVPAAHPDARLKTDAATLKMLVNREETIDGAVKSGRMELSGDDRAIKALLN